MDYFLSIALTLSCVWYIIVVINKWGEKSLKDIMYSQSSMHSRMRQFMPEKYSQINKPMSQVDQHMSKNMIRIVVVDNKAYWVADNIFYVANMDNGSIDHETVEQIKTDEMSKDELDKMLKILDNLKS